MYFFDEKIGYTELMFYLCTAGSAEGRRDNFKLRLYGVMIFHGSMTFNIDSISSLFQSPRTITALSLYTT